MRTYKLLLDPISGKYDVMNHDVSEWIAEVNTSRELANLTGGKPYAVVSSGKCILYPELKASDIIPAGHVVFEVK